MMMKSMISILSAILLLSSCCKRGDDTDANKVLLLKVDYQTRAFEGGTELSFPGPKTPLTIQADYKAPSDFGNISLYYKERNEKIFDGSIIWMGKGQINFPYNFQSASQFDRVMTADYVSPAKGFENVFNPNQDSLDYNPIWASVQSLMVVRDYLQNNPESKVQLFLYTPSVGVGDPADWDWILILKK